MTNLKNEQRIIRVSGCHDCPYISWRQLLGSSAWCRKLHNFKADIQKDNVDKYYRTKTLPSNCPLEKVKEKEE